MAGGTGREGGTCRATPGAAGAPRPRGGPAGQTPSDIEPEQHHVAVLDDVVLALHAVEPLLTGGSDRAAGDQVVVRHGLGLDEAPLEVRVNHAGGLRRRVTGTDRPRAHLLLARREVRPQAEQVVD